MPDDNVYPPSSDFVKHSNVSGMEQYRDLYQRALDDFEVGLLTQALAQSKGSRRQ